jgi:hypothetical protein
MFRSDDVMHMLIYAILVDVIQHRPHRRTALTVVTDELTSGTSK